MPLPPSSTTLMGVTAEGSMNFMASARKGSLTSSLVYSPGGSAASPGSPAVTMSRSSPIPASPDSARAPRPTSFAPV